MQLVTNIATSIPECSYVQVDVLDSDGVSMFDVDIEQQGNGRRGVQTTFEYVVSTPHHHFEELYTKGTSPDDWEIWIRQLQSDVVHVLDGRCVDTVRAVLETTNPVFIGGGGIFEGLAQAHWTNIKSQPLSDRSIQFEWKYIAPPRLSSAAIRNAIRQHPERPSVFNP